MIGNNHAVIVGNTALGALRRMKASRKHILYFSVMIGIILCFTLRVHVPLAAQEEAEAAPQAGFIVHTCDYDRENDAIQLQGTLIGSDGNPVPPDEYDVSVSIPSIDQTLAPEAVMAETVPTRPPLQVILVLDITETVPIPQIVEIIDEQLLQQLQPEDEIVLVAFSQEISPPSQPYLNKERFLEEQLQNLRPQIGDNRMYDAILDGVRYQFTNDEKRRVVFVVTDSSPRQEDIPSIDEIIEEAIETKTQIFTLAFFTADNPDVVGLQQLANSTDGYAWVVTDNADIETIGRSVSGAVGDFLRTLNSDIAIRADLNEVAADIADQVTFNIDINLANDPTLTDTITCDSVDRFKNEIAFVDDVNNITVTGQVDIGVVVNTRLPIEERRIFFFRDEQIIPNAANEVYTFNATVLQPGYYTLRAELRDSENTILAETDTEIELYAQQLIELTGQENERGALELEAQINPNIVLPEVFFEIALARNPENRVPLTEDRVAFIGNIAELEIERIRDYINDLPLNADNDNLIQITAYVPAEEEGQPDLAVSNILRIDLTPLPTPTPLPPTPTPTPLPPIVIAPRTTPQMIEQVILPSTIIFFLAINILLFGENRRERRKRLIRTPDRHDLSEQLMSVTIQREGMRQTHQLTKKTVYLGRGPGNDINLGGDSDISRNHGVIMWRKQAWYYSNRKRRAKARIDGRWYRGYQLRKLEPITTLEIGNAQLVFHASSQRDVSEFIITNI